LTEINSVFDAFDVDGDGHITIDELTKNTSAMVSAGVWTVKDLEDIISRVRCGVVVKADCFLLVFLSCVQSGVGSMT
jgi:hypothetical protein